MGASSLQTKVVRRRWRDRRTSLPFATAVTPLGTVTLKS